MQLQIAGVSSELADARARDRAMNGLSRMSVPTAALRRAFVGIGLA